MRVLISKTQVTIPDNDCCKECFFLFDNETSPAYCSKFGVTLETFCDGENPDWPYEDIPCRECAMTAVDLSNEEE